MRGVSGETVTQVRPRVLFAAKPTVELTGLQQFLETRNCRVVHCPLPTDVAHRVSDLTPHLIVISEPLLLDLLDLCREVRSVSQAPILVLGQRDMEEDEVLCLEYGADTYLGPGVSPRRLQAHAAALLQRGLAQVHVQANTVLIFGDIRVDVQRQRVYHGEREVELSHKEYSLLRFLMENAGQPVSRQALAEGVWGTGAASDSRSLDVHIHWLREKLEVDASNPQLIRTVRGVGYCFEV